jgi:hypothetical protein
VAARAALPRVRRALAESLGARRGARARDHARAPARRQRRGAAAPPGARRGRVVRRG